MSFLIPRDKSVVLNRKLSPHGGLSVFTNRSSLMKEPNDAVIQTLKELEEQDSSVINFYPAWCHCFQCLLAEKYRRSDKIPGWTRFKNAFLCPPAGVLSRFLYFIFCNCLFWLVTWGLHPDLAIDTISALIILELLGLTFGILMKVVGLPSLLAPLLLGIILNNIPTAVSFPHRFFYGLEKRGWVAPIRHIALAIILTRAGCELNPKQLRKLKGLVPMAAFGPCIMEALTCAVVMYGFFRNDGFPLALCFAAGFALAAVSPAVVVPGMLSLQKKNYGVNEGIPTLLIAASSIDDVLAISAFLISLSFAKGSKEQVWKTYAGPAGIAVGIFHGTVVGIFLHFIPSKDMGSNLPILRLVILLLFNVASVLLYEAEILSWLSGAGSLGVLTTSFIASFGWRSVPHWKPSMRRMEKVLAHIWTLFVPMLFGTIGKEVTVNTFVWTKVGKLVGIIFISLAVRLLVMYTISGFAKIKKKEQLFCALAWVPKATVQAALAPLVASEFQNDTKNIGFAGDVVLLAVLGILITAPLGAVLISVLGKRLLRQAIPAPDVPEPDQGPGQDDGEMVRVTLADSNLEKSPSIELSKEVRAVRSMLVFTENSNEKLEVPSQLSGPSVDSQKLSGSVNNQRFSNSSENNQRLSGASKNSTNEKTS